MTFTEIAIEVADDRHPLCRLTMPPHSAYGLFRIIDQGRGSGRFTSLISFVGSRELAQELMRDLAAGRPAGEVELIGQTDEMTTFRTFTSVGDATSPNVRLIAVLRLLQQLGPETLIEPILFRGGRIRARFLVPRHMEVAMVKVALADVQRASGFRDFRVLRVRHLEPARHVEVLRPLLTSEQDTLLRLAVSMGYYANPKGATLEEIAVRVGLSISPVHKRLKAAEEVLVTSHVGPGASSANGRRVRRVAPQADLGGPCELDVVARAPLMPLAQWTVAHPGTRVLLQPLFDERDTGMGTSLVLALGPAGQLTELLTTLRANASLTVEDVTREDHHVCVRVGGRAAEGWGLASFASGFQGEATLRHLVFEGDRVYARILLTRPSTLDEAEARLFKVVATLGWQDMEILMVASGGARRVPSELPEPLSARQEEVVKVAHALGYYRTPRSCTLEHVASTLGVSANAIHKNLVGAEARIISHYLAAGL